ncbi:dienelactone hydrolase family protein [Curtobacterium pusillum]|uniref:Dienelactone hydrolase domain-containing protein n=1 Tax=Curtobacterium pusillum TaxID=69373 RepID=A0ABX2MEQ3_9MICO|nr:dienelactone hydrolase family protein [Curtobacterium pusillum]NUU15263.1 hypothetical protein [Curtobacterium pusillum]GLK31404.1 dienelactone hydrolase [Curtobacterium pusillum]
MQGDHLIGRDVEYSHGDTVMIGRSAAPATGGPHPGVVLVHDAFGLTEAMIRTSEEYAARGYAVLAADVWGSRTTPTDGAAIGSLIGGMVADRAEWAGRIAAAHRTLLARPDVDADRTAMVGWCFGGSSAIEFVRGGGAVRGIVSVHGGLDLLGDDWTTPTDARVLLCTGADDPMATPEMLFALQRGLDAVGADWEADVYSGTRHAFTNPDAALAGPPDVVGYHARSARRAHESAERFLADLLAP